MILLAVIGIVASAPLWVVQAIQLVAQAVAQRYGATSGTPEVAAAAGLAVGVFGCFALLYSVVAVLPLWAGVIACFISIMREGTPRLGLIFEGYRRFPRVLGAAVLLWVVQVIPLLLGFAVIIAISAFGVGLDRFKDGVQRADLDGYSVVALVAGGAWLLACLIVAWWIQLRTLFTLFVIVDPSRPDQGVVASIEQSWLMTRGSALSLLGLCITLSLLTNVTMLCCCAPLVLVGIPVCLAVLTAAYLQLLEREPSAVAVTPPSA